MRTTIAMPLETLISIIQRAREFEPGEEGAIEAADLEGDDLELVAEDEEESDQDDDDEEDEDDGDTAALAAEDLSDEIDDGEDDDAAEEDDESDDEEEELDELLAGLSNEELAEVLALAWIGGGECEAANWPQALEAARALLLASAAVVSALVCAGARREHQGTRENATVEEMRYFIDCSSSGPNACERRRTAVRRAPAPPLIGPRLAFCA